MAEKTNHQIETSLTLDYRKSAWGLERILLDGFSNHLPEDSGGTSAEVLLKQYGQYVPLQDADRSKPTEEVVFQDNGPGYDSGLLSVLFSSKGDNDLSVGQFGEGMKLIAAAALRQGIDLEYQSQNWVASPFSKPETIGGHEVERLCFDVEVNGHDIQGSRTVIRNPSDELMREVYSLPDKVLALNDLFEDLSAPRTYHRWKEYPARILRIPGGKPTLFVKGIKVREIDSVLSYDVGTDAITPDRSFVNTDNALDEIAGLLRGHIAPEGARELLIATSADPRHIYFEFQALGSVLKRERDEKSRFGLSIDHTHTLNLSEFKDSENYLNKHNPWVKSFIELFGENAVLASYLDTNQNKEAELLGFNPIQVNHAVYTLLDTLGVKNVDSIIAQSEYRWIGNDELTESEKAVLELAPKIDMTVLGYISGVPLRVYKGLFSPAGRELESSLGAYDTKNKTIGVKRTLLEDPSQFVPTYIHELGHHVTQASDYDRRFTDFFVQSLAKLALAYVEKKD